MKSFTFKKKIKFNIIKILLLYIGISFINILINAQENSNGNGIKSYIITHEDSLALENVIVEEYYVADSSDYSDTSGGILPKGAITYRIYIDMNPGYSLQMVYGSPKHELYIKTSTTFFNNLECLASTGFNIDARLINKNTIALDSWITMGAATRLQTGILKSEDKDGSLMNRPALFKADGLTKGVLPYFMPFNIDLNFFKDNQHASCFSTKNGAWSAPGGVKGPTDENKVLVAQLTTNGKLSFQLNIQIGTPSKGFIQFVASNPEGSEIQFNGLTYNN